VKPAGSPGREVVNSGDVRNITALSGTPVPCDVLDVAIAASRRAGAELSARFGRSLAEADRAAEASILDVLGRRRPADSIAIGRPAADREGTTALRWLVDPLNGDANYLTGIPLFCVSVACEDPSGTLAGVVYDPIRDELFATVRGGAVRGDGAPARGSQPRSLEASSVTGAIACATEIEAKRAGKLEKRLFRRVGQRRALGSAALELAWTAAGRFDACFHEQWLSPRAVDAGLFLCRRSGLRVHRLPPLEDGAAPRLLAAREPLAAEVLVLVGPGSKERRRAAQRPSLSTGSVTKAMRRRRGQSGLDRTDRSG
jgi:myo-inositol-1(or 4)-monophosphatase